jgi:hypothetical protein
MRATCPDHFILLDLIILIIFNLGLQLINIKNIKVIQEPQVQSTNKKFVSCIKIVVVRKSEWWRSAERSRHRMDDNIETDLKKTGRVCADWIHVSQDRVQWRVIVNKTMHFRVPFQGREFLAQLGDHISLKRRTLLHGERGLIHPRGEIVCVCEDQLWGKCDHEIQHLTYGIILL